MGAQGAGTAEVWDEVQPQLQLTAEGWVSVLPEDGRGSSRLLRRSDGSWALRGLSDGPEAGQEWPISPAAARRWLALNGYDDLLREWFGPLEPEPAGVPGVRGYPATRPERCVLRAHEPGQEPRVVEQVDLTGALVYPSAMVWDGLHWQSRHTLGPGTAEWLIRTADRRWLLHGGPSTGRGGYTYPVADFLAHRWLLANRDAVAARRWFGEVVP